MTAFTWRNTTFYIYYGLLLVALLLSCLTDQPPLFCATVKTLVSPPKVIIVLFLFFPYIPILVYSAGTQLIYRGKEKFQVFLVSFNRFLTVVLQMTKTNGALNIKPTILESLLLLLYSCYQLSSTLTTRIVGISFVNKYPDNLFASSLLICSNQ